MGEWQGKQPLTFFQGVVRSGLSGSKTSTYAAGPIVYSSKLESFIFDTYVYGRQTSLMTICEFSFITSDLTFYFERLNHGKN